jgi:TonB family protein
MNSDPRLRVGPHGIDGFFAERARCSRRTSMLSAGLALLMLGALQAARLPGVRAAIEQLPPALRFGIQGPNRIVPVVNLDIPAGNDAPLRHVGTLVPTDGRGGRGGGEPTPARAPARRAESTGLPLHGIGDDTQDLIARALASQGKVPIFQSEELVIEHLVRPEYPENAKARGAEGRVSVLALVDTAGRVVEAAVMKKSGEPDLDQAAEVAVMQCRFRPYKEMGETREVYAVFRFAFRIY